MAICAYCKSAETQLHENDVPICLKCANIRAEIVATENDDGYKPDDARYLELADKLEAGTMVLKKR